METTKRWCIYIERDGKEEYLSYIDIVGNLRKKGLCIKFSDDVKEAVKYRVEFRAKEDIDLLGWQKYREKVAKETGGNPLKYRLLTPEEAAE